MSIDAPEKMQWFRIRGSGLPVEAAHRAALAAA
jgi:hypothetical protein